MHPGRIASILGLGLVLIGAPAAAQAPSPSSVPSASMAAVASDPGPAIDQPVYTDGFDDPSAWVTGDTENGSIRVEEGALAIDVTAPDSSMWTWHRLDAEWPALAVSGTVRSDTTDGLAGWMCGTPEPSYLVGIVGPTGWMTGVTGVQGALLDSGTLPAELAPAVDGSIPVAIECFTTGTGSRLRLWLAGVLVSDVESALAGPWDRVGAYADVGVPPNESRFDQLFVLGGLDDPPAATPASFPAASPAG